MLSSAALTVFFSMGLTAQEPKTAERTKIDTDDAKVVTWTGCLRASGDGFDLTEVRRAKDGDAGKGDAGKEERTPTVVMLRHVPESLDLKAYINRRVAITGATEKDVFEDIEVKVRTETTTGRKDQPNAKAKTTAEVEADPRGHNILVPVSIREISKTCR